MSRGIGLNSFIKRQRGSMLVMTLAVVVVLGGFAAGVTKVMQTQSDASADIVRDARAFAAMDSYRLMVMKGYDPAMVGQSLAGMLYGGDGSSGINFDDNDGYSGGLTIGGRTWGYDFEFDGGVGDVGDFKDFDGPETLPPGCDWNVSETEFICVWAGNEPWSGGGYPRGKSEKSAKSNKSDKSYKSVKCNDTADWASSPELMHRAKWFATDELCASVTKQTPADVNSASQRAAFTHDTHQYDGYFKFPAPTRFVLKSGAEVLFTGPVVFAGDLTIERGDDRGGDLVFQKPVAMLGQIDVRGFLNGDDGFLDAPGSTHEHLDWGGEVAFQGAVFLGGDFMIPALDDLSNNGVFARRGWFEGNYRGQKYRVAAPFWLDQDLSLSMDDTNIVVSMLRLIDHPRRVEYPARIIFGTDVHQGTTSQYRYRVKESSISWEIRIMGYVNESNGNNGKNKSSKKSKKSAKKYWAEFDAIDINFDIVTVAGSVTQGAELADLSQPVVGEFTLENLANEEYGFTGWRMKQTAEARTE